MEQNCTFQAMNRFLNQVEQLPDLDFLAQFEDSYHLKEFKLPLITAAFAAEIYHDIFLKFMKNYAPRTELHWGQNELRLFMWALACHLQMARIPIEQLGHDDWEHFCSLLPNKQPILFEYQALSLYKEPVPAKKWAQQQDDLFLTLIQSKDGKYKWSQLAKQLYIGSNRQYFRTPKQCRERWLNHLDPNKSKDEWELKEDFTLISHVITKGKKWAEISKLLKSRRNQHSIKNRFKSLITRQQKLHPDVHDQRALVDLIYKKYDNHFTKLRLMNAINSQHPSSSEMKQEQMLTQSNISQKQLLTKEIFSVLKSKDECKVENNEQPSLLSIDNNMNSTYQNPAKNDSFLDVIRQAREKQIRADIFLSQDPFEELKKFFKPKDVY